MPPALAPPTDRRHGSPRADAPGPPTHDDLAETPRPTDEDLAARRRLSRPGAKPREPRPADPPGYRLRTLIGRGAFGAVWLAEEAATGKRVAVKTFRHVRALDWPLLTREVEKLAALDASRHVVRLLDVGWDADPPFYVMEYLPDGSLADKLADGGPLPVAEAVRVAEGVAAGLVHAHGSGILHCDLKPGNVLLDRDGQPRLCDFGQARGVNANSASGGRQPPEAGANAAPPDSAPAASNGGGPPLGTLFYMPPEQTLPDAAPDARWDVYALGAVLYETLVGSPPHRTDALADRLRNVTGTADRLAAYRRAVSVLDPPAAHRDLPGVDADLARIVDRCLARDPADRYPNAQAVRNALAERTAAAGRRSRVRWALLGPAALAATLIPVGALLARQTVDAAREQVVHRALDANALSARVVARSLEGEVRRKREELEALAETDPLPALVAAAAAAGWADGEARAALGRFLARRTRVIAPDAKPERRGDVGANGGAANVPAGDISWFLQDATGITRWRKPDDAGVVDHNFVWRDYFHAQAEDLPRDTPPGAVPPLSATHVSLPFLSTTTAERKLAISTPVRDADGRVIAVLARTVLLDSLLQEYDSFKKGITGEPGAATGGGASVGTEPRFSRAIALYDRRSGELLDHPWLTARPAATAAQRDAARMDRDDRDLLDRAAAVRGGVRTAAHRDPVARLAGGGDFAGPWLAAFAPVGGTDWVAAVQEPRGAALRPVESLREVLLRTGAATILGVVVALAGVYAWLTRDRPADP